MNIDSWNRTHESCLLIANPDNKQQIIKHRHFLNEQLLSFRIKEDDYLVQIQLILGLISHNKFIKLFLISYFRICLYFICTYLVKPAINVY